MRRKAHIAVDVLVRYARPELRGWFTLLAEACVLVFLGIVFWASRPVLEVTSETRATATDIPMSWVYLAAPVGCILIGIETLRLMARSWREMRGGSADDPALVFAFVVLLLIAAPVSIAMAWRRRSPFCGREKCRSTPS